MRLSILVRQGRYSLVAGVPPALFHFLRPARLGTSSSDQRTRLARFAGSALGRIRHANTTKRRDGLCSVHAIQGRHGGRPSAGASLESSFNLTPAGEDNVQRCLDSGRTDMSRHDKTEGRALSRPRDTRTTRTSSSAAALEFEHGSSAWTYSVRGLVRLECTDGYCSPAAFTFRLRNQTASNCERSGCQGCVKIT